jgi:hypothetical protein
VLDPEVDPISIDGDLTFTAVRWELVEASLVSVPADSAAMVRSLGGHVPNFVREARARMATRARMYARQAALRGS